MKPFVKALLTLLMITALGWGQNPPEMPKPGPELKKLDYFAGEWKMEGDMKPSPFGPGGKFTRTEKNDWMDGGFFVLSHSDMNSPMGKANGLAVLGYKGDENKYSYNAFNSTGEAEAATGSLDGDTWTWTSQERVGGKVMNGRYTMKILSPTSYTFKFEMQPEGGEWGTIMDGKATKK